MRQAWGGLSTGLTQASGDHIDCRGSLRRGDRLLSPTSQVDCDSWRGAWRGLLLAGDLSGVPCTPAHVGGHGELLLAELARAHKRRVRARANFARARAEQRCSSPCSCHLWCVTCDLLCVRCEAGSVNTCGTRRQQQAVHTRATMTTDADNTGVCTSLL